jgi:predicted methyltransferase
VAAEARAGLAKRIARVRVVTALLVVLSAVAVEAQRGRQATPLPGGRLFAPQDLLESPDREVWQKPDQIMDALGIADGSVVADLGAGDGWFSIRLSHRVGPNGRVWAEDIQPAMVSAIERTIARENLRNVRPLLGAPNDPRLPAGIDAVVMIDVYRELDIPPADPVKLLSNVAKTLAPGGRIGVVDFNPGAGGPGPAPDERIDPEQVIAAAMAAGLRLIAHDPHVNPFQFLLVFGRAS